MRQESLFQPTPKFHGGKLALGKRKSRRPLSSKHPTHLVLKAKGNIYGHRPKIEAMVKKQSERAHIRLYDLAVAHNHVHILIKIPGRREYMAFLRALTGLLARLLGKGVWSLLPFTRVATWGRDYLQLRNYFRQNRDEASGKSPYSPRTNWYKRFY